MLHIKVSFDWPNGFRVRCLNIMIIFSDSLIFSPTAHFLQVLPFKLEFVFYMKTDASPLSKCKHIQYSRVMIFVFCTVADVSNAIKFQHETFII